MSYSVYQVYFFSRKIIELSILHSILLWSWSYNGVKNLLSDNHQVFLVFLYAFTRVQPETQVKLYDRLACDCKSLLRNNLLNTHFQIFNNSYLWIQSTNGAQDYKV